MNTPESRQSPDFITSGFTALPASPRLEAPVPLAYRAAANTLPPTSAATTSSALEWQPSPPFTLEPQLALGVAVIAAFLLAVLLSAVWTLLIPRLRRGPESG